MWLDEDGCPHRFCGPAIEFHNGRKEWFVHGLRHRDDKLPAIESEGMEFLLMSGQVVAFANGKRHFVNGIPLMMIHSSLPYEENLPTLILVEREP